MFGTLTDRFNDAFRKLSGQARISESNVREAMEDVRTALLEADANYEVVQKFMADVQAKALGQEVLAAVRPGQQMIKIVYDELVALMGGVQDQPPVMEVDPGPTIVMMSGLQGSGKTTTCGKLAAYLKKRGKSVMLCAADLQRPGAVRQLEILVEQVGSPDFPGAGRVLFYGEPEKVAEYGKAVGAAVTVCRNAVAAARKEKIDVLILDTAGRLHINSDLMDELRRVEQAVQPHHIYLVIDAMTGQDAVNSAKAFNEQLELDGVILTKFDSDTRGGAALSVKHVTSKPIRFIGVGEKLDALEEFHPERIATRILGMGDVVSLVEKAQEQVSEAEAEALQEKMAKGQLTMEDFLKQLKTLRRMGSIKGLLGMLPGVGSQIKDMDLDEKEINRTEAIIQSMTPAERRDINLLNNSRRRRISRGSGSPPEAVGALVKGFEAMSHLTKQMAGMNMMAQMLAMSSLKPADIAGMATRSGVGRFKAPAKEVRKTRFKDRKKRSR